MNTKNHKGFTLIELLIVIAIIAVLSVVVILSLNPAELLRQARDSNRISDMATMKSAVSLYLADVASPFLGTSSICYISAATSSNLYVPSSGGSFAVSSTCANWMTMGTTTANVTATTSRSIGVAGATAGIGWLPVDFNNISSGAPIAQEPIDPVNQAGTASCLSTSTLGSCGLFYSYGMSGSNFKLATVMESLKYSKGGGNDVETSDGGSNTYVYEGGTNPAL